MRLHLPEISEATFMKSHQHDFPKYELNKDKNRHAKIDEGKPTKLQSNSKLTDLLTTSKTKSTEDEHDRMR